MNLEVGSLRHFRAALTSASSIAGRVVALGTTLATIPLALQQLGLEGFGLWMTVASLTSLLGFADLGIGNGVMSAIADASGREDWVKIRTLVSSALVLLSLVGLGILLVAVVLVTTLDMSSVLGASESVSADLRLTLVLFAFCFAMTIPATLVVRLQMGLQQGYLAGLWQVAGNLVGFAGVVTALRTGAGLHWMVVALVGGPLLAAVFNSVHYFVFKRPDLRPAARFVELAQLGELLRLGGLFFVLQLAAAVAFASDNIVTARALGAAAVADFSVAARVFSVVSLLVLLLLQPLWPAYAEAIARRDLNWVRRTMRRVTVIAVAVSAVCSLTLFSFFDALTLAWLGREVQVTSVLLLGFAFWVVVEAAGNSLSMMLNGARVVKPQVLLAIIFALVCVTLKIGLIGRFGVEILPWVTFGTYCLISLVPASILMSRITAKL